MWGDDILSVTKCKDTKITRDIINYTSATILPVNLFIFQNNRSLLKKKIKTHKMLVKHVSGLGTGIGFQIRESVSPLAKSAKCTSRNTDKWNQYI